MFLISGGGIGGLSIAVGLGRLNRDFLVLEQAAELRELGAGLLLSPNAVRALQALEIWDAVAAKGKRTTQWDLLNDKGTLLRKVRIPGSIPSLSIHRADLHNILLKEVGLSRIRLNSKTVSYQEFRNCVSVRLAGGGTVEGSALIGADGLWSAVREQRFGHARPQYGGYGGWRGVASFVPKGYEGDRLSESWGRGGRFGIAPIDEHRTYWYASDNLPEHWRPYPETHREYLSRRYANWHEPVLDLIRATPEEQILFSPIHDRRPRWNWSSPRVTLLGDAAHPMTPNLGQGACSAMEDAVVLMSLLKRHSVVSALRTYSRRRWPRTAIIQMQSRMVGWAVQAQSYPMIVLRNAITRCLPESLIDTGMSFLFNYDAARS